MLEKNDLEMIREVVREEIQGVRVELKEEIQGVRAELKEEIQEVKEDIQEVKVELRDVKRTADKALEVASKTQLLLENDISKRINIIGEGHHFLWTRLEEARRMDKMWEQIELEVISMRMEFKELKEMKAV